MTKRTKVIPQISVAVPGLDPLRPVPSTLAKLGSLIVHAEEFLSADRHEFDLAAFRQLLDDPEVATWLAEMRRLALVPKMRSGK